MNNINLDKISEDHLLDQRICDLPLSMEGTWLEDCISELYRELEEKGIPFRPACYLADEWLTPQNETVIGIPFYLAHSTLMKLEHKAMLEVEGGTKDWCMKLLRHEAGHALTYAYKLNRRKMWQKHFGSSEDEYKDTYRFRPYSKNYVQHLEDHYAQYHPDEDFVETFAVWLTPNLDWREKYKGWGALKKLKYVDQLMDEIKGKPPFVRSAKKLWRQSTLKITLRKHYKRRRSTWIEEFPDFHDMSLKMIFTERNESNKKRPSASKIINHHRRDIINSVYTWTREKKYVISDVIKRINQRARFLKLVVPEPPETAIVKLTSYITTLVMNYSYTGKFRGEKQKKK